MNKFTVPVAIAGPLLALSFTPGLIAAEVDDVTDGSPYYYQADPGTPVVPGVGDPKSTTDSGINHLPVYHGNMQTNKTYRFVNVMEQVFTMIGDGKHGLWRYQDNGTIREYNTDTSLATGLVAPDGTDLTHPDAMADYVAGLTGDAIGSQYANVFDTGGDFSGYKSNANVESGMPAPFLDIPISHERYQGKYSSHVPIDLPGYYCTMSANSFLKSKAAMDFAFAQPAAGKVGPLGERAGLDIVENYPRVLRLESFPDAKMWANTRSEDSALWQQINTYRTEAEIYLVERPFFNEPYLFIVVVFDDKAHHGHGYGKRRASQHSYIRPHGAYYEHLQERKANGERLPKFNTRLTQQPVFNVVKRNRNGYPLNRKRRVHGTRLYGVHHPGVDVNPNVAVTNGACPSMGGDFGESYYGSAWPNNYQEVTPLCDGIVIDIKLWANLDDATWNDERKNLANNTGTFGLDPANPRVKHYSNKVDLPAANPGMYGVFQDPYLVDNGIMNPDQFDATGTDMLTFPSANPQVEIVE